MSRSVQRQRVLPALLAPSSSIPRVLDDDEPEAFDPVSYARARSEAGAHEVKREPKRRSRKVDPRAAAIREQLLTLAESIDADDWAQVQDAAHALSSWAVTDAEWDRSALLAVMGVLEVLAADMVAQTPTPPGEPEVVELDDDDDDDDDDDAEQLELFGDE